jgi:hypothetical protein
MLKFLKNSAWALYLGFSVSAFAKCTCMTWQFWAICIPVVLFVTWKSYPNN